jgi:membrane protease YdiL (CAAX protease family)
MAPASKSHLPDETIAPASHLVTWPRATLKRRPLAWFFGLVLALTWLAQLGLALVALDPYVEGRLILMTAYAPALVAMGLSAVMLPERERPRPAARAGLFAIVFAAGMAVQWLDRTYWGHDHRPAWVAVDAVLTALAAFVISGRLSSRRGVRELLRPLSGWRVRPIWYLVAFGLWPALMLAANAIAPLLGEAVPGAPVVPNRPWLPLVVESYLCFALYGGPLNEEPGWRGFALPRLQQRHSPLVASLIVGVVWGLWHVPLHLMGLYPGGAWGSLIRIQELPRAVVFTWLYNRTGSSLLIAVPFHAAVNTTSLFLPRAYLTTFGLLVLLAAGLVLAGRMWRASSANTNQRRT